ncbi:similar to Saccharomyces cerevisiae YPL126W NAN1 U3 snoRNP protein, component of the small (ribosomal) subunit (SSU) processosome containing U3 snoRNA [Maudiozyma saulgeensis]|uniref:Similar to Saccharomyces cerevisiae YPL126W NAN1 U3 snoRNP protein, component of the small (Ribosomal) subunit (SSU) processosome containing U3 snoRNA n=1 Tax=Maudiozyma saulgeensis TaxID=1789683 RepID=A0A1X7R9L4_9SACH|nr:similar to Saccharomyces cerevisiae YPL126W NAN1 U3 snoRNP protein, component of the small (ribosomal) subunit (SSU) processosome containing U3 snoRNA [Kazachstania saulgeensis]
MTQMSSITQKYQLSVVSGGRPILPGINNATSCQKNISVLVHDQQGIIVPFNNQIRIYSLETRQCIKTLKYANSPVLSTIFDNKKLSQKIYIVGIMLGDITVKDENLRQKEKLITIFTNFGQVIVLNYKGKLIDSPKLYQLELDSEKDESLLKVFDNGKELKIMTTLSSNGSLFDYKLSSLKFPEISTSSLTETVKLTESEIFTNIVLSAWSKDENVFTLLYKDINDNNQRHILVQSIFSKSMKKDIALESVLHVSQNTKNNQNVNSRFVSTMAIDNSASQLALGFASGVISIINLSDLQNRLLKWHIDSVLSLCFTDDGSYLLSGGWEKVLLFWQLSTNTQQFLPRLNGVVVDIQNEGKFYTLSLQMTENQSSSDYELIVLNSADLTSKLSVTGPLPIFNSPIRDTTHPTSVIKSNTQINVSKKKHKRKLLKSARQDFTTIIEMNPQTKQLYIPHLSTLQTFDFYKNEQTCLQFLTDGMNNTMGKVREELSIRDPEVQNIKITNDGNWLISYEVDFPPEDLMSSKDISHILKFWTHDETDPNQWVLRTKVLNPHGRSTPITNIKVAPISVDNGVGCITTDNNGGMKYWAFDSMEKNWCLKKLLIPNFTNFSNSVSLGWSRDGSLIFHGFDDKLQIIDFDNFKRVDLNINDTDNNDLTMTGEFTMDSEIQAVKMIGEKNLIIATKTSLNVIDLLLGKIINGFDLYPYVNGVYKNGHLDRLISCDDKSEKMAIVINEQVKDTNGKNTLDYKSHIIIFNSDLTQQLDAFTHDEYISWISWNHDTDFIFVDIQSRFGIVGTTVNTEMADEANREDILDGIANNNINNTNSINNNNTNNNSSIIEPSSEQTTSTSDSYLNKLKELSRKKTNININGEPKSSELNGDAMEIEEEIISGNRKSDKGINMNSFTNMFENIQNVPMETLFDSVMKALS